MARPGSNPVKHDSNFFGHNNFCEENRGCTHIQGATDITCSTVVLIFDESGLSRPVSSDMVGHKSGKSTPRIIS